MTIKKTTSVDFSLSLAFSNGKSIKASVPVTFIPDALPSEIFDDTTSKMVNASEPFQLNLKFRDECGNARPLYVGLTNFTCSLIGLGYENSIVLPGPCKIEASKLYADTVYKLSMAYAHNYGGPSTPIF